MPRPAVRIDIQALRALAVAMVVIYHLWPHELPGGYTGVDAFFVISGFLITTQLMTEIPRRGTDLLRFWSRRIRRLLPAALLVLAATLAGSRLLAPDTEWGNTAAHARAAALYFVNWRLAYDAVDYLANQGVPTPVQHFWSLSVEEQFYVFWPVLIFVVAWAAARLGLPVRAVVTLSLVAVVVVSFWYSLHETAVAPTRAFFVTPTRMWELGAGGLLAVLKPSLRASRASVLWSTVAPVAGYAALLGAAIVYGPTTAFPGWHAALPVLGSAAIIAARAPDRGSILGRLLAARPVQWTGDVSYSLYLWHWPLIVLAPDLLHHPLGTVDRFGVVLTSLLLAALTTRFVEDPFRRPAWSRPLVKPYAVAAAAMAVVVGATVLQTYEVDQRAQRNLLALHASLAQLATPLPSSATPRGWRAAPAGASPRTTAPGVAAARAPRSCFGAAALTPTFHCVAATRTGSLTPSPLGASYDRSDAYSSVSGTKDCFASAPDFAIVVCERGDAHGAVRIALVGNSHAGQWLPALERVAAALHWRVTTYLASQCAYAQTDQTFPTAAGTRNCSRWTARVTAALVTHRYGLVVITNRISVNAVGAHGAASRALYLRGYLAVLRKLASARLRVLGVHDTPAPGELVPDCLATHPSDYLACAGRRSAWLPGEPLSTAIATMQDPRITIADLTDRICLRALCPAAVGRVPVYVDGSHLTATYAATLAPYLEPDLLAALRTP